MGVAGGCPADQEVAASEVLLQDVLTEAASDPLVFAFPHACGIALGRQRLQEDGGAVFDPGNRDCGEREEGV